MSYSIPQLENAITRLSVVISTHKYWYGHFQNEGDWVCAKWFMMHIFQNLNRVADLETSISTLKLSGDTDAITTKEALSILKVDFSIMDGGFFINS